MHMAVLSLEPWDDVWRRNQHLSVELVRQGLVSSLTFVEPPRREVVESRSRAVPAGIRVVSPRLRLPRTLGGLRYAGRRLKRDAVRGVDLLWVNDPALGVHCLSPSVPAVYDVTDDWRTYPFPPRIVRRIVRAEGRLARAAMTVVCSPTLRDRWQTRYSVTASVVATGIDVPAWASVSPRSLDGAGPHVGYVGTIQAERLDIDLVLAVADSPVVGTVHLVGPDALDCASRQRLSNNSKIRLEGAVPAIDVPSWTKAMDVLICPHRVDEFTLSLDAIKAREYLASGRPVVATATSGFQDRTSNASSGMHVVPADHFVASVERECQDGGRRTVRRDIDGMSWSSRAQDFYSVCRQAATTTAGPELLCEEPAHLGI